MVAFSFITLIPLALGATAPSPKPTVDPSGDAKLTKYAACIAKFLDDITVYQSCLDRHAGRRCWFDNNVMTTMHDSHNCLALITMVPTITYDALIIQRAHDICYDYLSTVGECLGMAVEVADLTPCYRNEVLARFGLIIDKCKKETAFQEPSSPMW